MNLKRLSAALVVAMVFLSIFIPYQVSAQADDELDMMISNVEADNTATENGSETKRKDSDGDGLSNEREKKMGWDPHDPDMDGDGLEDGREVSLQTDPTSSDTDGDGINDKAEVEQGTNPSVPNKEKNITQSQSVSSDSEHDLGRQISEIQNPVLILTVMCISGLVGAIYLKS